MQANINYHIWFKACRSIKRKYGLTTNCLLVLNGSYLLYMTVKKGFTMRNLRNFVSYYNHNQIKSYITYLLKKEYIIESGIYNGRVLYNLSFTGNQIIKELNDSYDKELVLFCSKYNIEL
jgi:hypothetical protein